MADRIALIGAGPSGLSMLRAFQQAAAKGASVPSITCFEKQSDWGGLWNLTWRTGLDEFGEPVHTSMYQYLWSNGPKECLEFADYSFEEHFGRPIPSFPPREVLADYIRGRAEKSGVRNQVRFNTVVRDVSYDADNDEFTVVTENLIEHKRKIETFDWVIVASGHYSTPNVPTFPGIDQFPGRVMHAHDFRDAREFSGKHLLCIGASYSAEDIALQCHKYGAASVTTCYRSNAMNFKWPEGIDERPLLTQLDGATAHFKDGSSKDFDAIILCTGYQHHFPFLADDLRLQTGNCLYPAHLYKGVVWLDNPKLLYLGMQDQFYTFSMFDVQAWWARDLIMGRIDLPARDQMEADSQAWVAREATLEDVYQQIWFQAEYMRELMAVIDYPEFDLDLTAEEFCEWEHDKDEDIAAYRNKAFKSAVTGTMSPSHHTAFLEALDDSMETFLGDG